MEFCETSALHDYNVGLAFTKSAEKVLERINTGRISPSDVGSILTKGVEGVRVNLAYKDGKFLPAHLGAQIQRGRGDIHHADLRRVSADREEPPNCKLCCE
jgi:hypothetical protein